MLPRLAADVEKFDGDSQLLRRRLDCLPFRWRHQVFHIMQEAYRAIAGATSFSSSIRLPANSAAKALRPVTFPPGRAKVGITPAPVGSPIAVKTMSRPASAVIMLLPQRSHIPSGALKTAVAYPSVATAYTDKAVRDEAW